MALVCGVIASGCSGEDAPPPSGDDGSLDPVADEPNADSSADGQEPAAGGDEFAVTFTGQAIVMNARAELQVNEGERDVHLSVTGRTPGTDVLVVDITFDGLENTFGAHSVQFSLPEGGPHDVNGTLNGEWYYSQSGQAELTLTPEGRLDGRFQVRLARAEEIQPGTVIFSPTADSSPLDVTFSVPWVLSCHSRLAGHGILQPGGDFCDELDASFEL
jgi:hypothetical protein